MKNLEACMQQGIATSHLAIGAPTNPKVPIIEGCATTYGKDISNPIGLVFFIFQIYLTINIS